MSGEDEQRDSATPRGFKRRRISANSTALGTDRLNTSRTHDDGTLVLSNHDAALTTSVYQARFAASGGMKVLLR